MNRCVTFWGDSALPLLMCVNMIDTDPPLKGACMTPNYDVSDLTYDAIMVAVSDFLAF